MKHVQTDEIHPLVLCDPHTYNLTNIDNESVESFYSPSDREKRISLLEQVITANDVKEVSHLTLVRPLPEDKTKFIDNNVREIIDRSLESNIQRQISLALNLIFENSPKEFYRVFRSLEFFVPLVSISDLFTTNFTEENLIKVVFTSHHANEYKMSEVLIHEALHSELFFKNSIEPVIKEDCFDYRVFSPWRNELRPIYMVFHALYVFVPVVRFYRALERNGYLDTKALRSYESFIERVFSIFPKERLTHYGKNIYQELEREFRNKMKEDVELSVLKRELLFV